MWNRELITASGVFRRTVDFYLQDASDDWVMLGAVLASASGILRETVHAEIPSGPVPRAEILAVGELLLGELFDHGVLIGELVAGDPGLEVWPGTRVDWFARIRDWVRAHDKLPLPGEFGWLLDPTQQSWRAVSDYHEAPDRMDPRRITAHDAFDQAVDSLCSDPAGVIPIGVVFVTAHTTLRETAYRVAPSRVPFPLDEVLFMADLLLAQLFDHELTPGEITDTGFTPWSGTAAEWRQRVQAWADGHHRLPELRDCAWLMPANVTTHTVVSVTDYFDHVITTRPAYRDYVDWDLRDTGEHPVDISLPFRSADSVIQRLVIPGNIRPSVWNDTLRVAGLILNELFDHGVVAGDSPDGEQSEPERGDERFPAWPTVRDFVPWPGARDDWLARIHDWTDEHHRRPERGELGVLYRPDGL